jgi:hypothetical protein
VYTGEWHGSRRHGRGVHIFAGGVSKYEGQFKDNKRHGRGAFTYTNGNVFDGEWIQDNSAQGIVMFANGNTYEGQLQDAEMHGYVKRSHCFFPTWLNKSPPLVPTSCLRHGIHTWADGGKYDGQHVNGKSHGT